MSYDNYHDPISFLRALKLKQEPPRVRTIRYGFDRIEEDDWGGGRRIKAKTKLVRLAFPWVSIGRDDKIKSVHVFFHNQPWKTVQEAIKIVRLPPAEFFHITEDDGSVCLGEEAHSRIFGYKKRLSPSQAFWLTTNCDGTIKGLPRSMRDWQHPERVLKYAWEVPLWWDDVPDWAW